MEAFSYHNKFKLMENFEMVRIFKGQINSVENKTKNGSLVKILLIQSVQEMNKKSGIFQPILEINQSKNNQSYDQKLTIRIKLKKEWGTLNLYRGITVIFIGQLKKSKTNSFSFSFTIPSKKYKRSNIFNTMIIEPYM